MTHTRDSYSKRERERERGREFLSEEKKGGGGGRGNFISVNDSTPTRIELHETTRPRLWLSHPRPPPGPSLSYAVSHTCNLWWRRPTSFVNKFEVVHVREKSHRSVTEYGVGGMGVGRVCISRLGLSDSWFRRNLEAGGAKLHTMNTSRSHIGMSPSGTQPTMRPRLGRCNGAGPDRHTVGFRSGGAGATAHSHSAPPTLLSYYFFYLLRMQPHWGASLSMIEKSTGSQREKNLHYGDEERHWKKKRKKRANAGEISKPRQITLPSQTILESSCSWVCFWVFGHWGALPW